MVIKYSSNFEKKFNKLQRKNILSKTKLDQKLRLLTLNPRHPSLRLHKIESRNSAWSISIDMSLRILFVYRAYGILLVDIGSHNEVY